MITIVSNDYLKYNYENHQYYITRKYMADRFGIDLVSALKDPTDNNIDTLPERFLQDISDTVYAFIQNYSYSQSYLVKELWIAEHTEAAKAIQLAMGETVRDLLSTQNDIAMQNGIDPSGGNTISRKTLQSATIPIKAESILMKADVLFRGFIDHDPNELKKRGVEY